jgi:hypothetical protein
MDTINKTIEEVKNLKNMIDGRIVASVTIPYIKKTLLLLDQANKETEEILTENKRLTDEHKQCHEQNGRLLSEITTLKDKLELYKSTFQNTRIGGIK